MIKIIRKVDWGTFFSTLVVFVAVALAALVAGVPKLMGGTSLTVLTQSMEPNIKAGDLIAIAPKPCREIQPGDVITFMPKPNDPTQITHRVITKTSFGGENCEFTTKGDNNANPDADVVMKKQVNGKMLYRVPIPKLGVLAQGVGGRSGITVGIAGLFFVYAVYLWFKPEKTKNKNTKKNGGNGEKDREA